MPKPRKVRLSADLVVPLVGDAAIAGPIADGRLIPVLILDTTARGEVAELIQLHRHLQPGDAISQWGTSQDNSDEVMLMLTFTQPMDLELVLLLGIERQAILVETMINAGAVYLQAGTAGDRLATTMDAPRVLVELPDTGFRDRWDELLLERMTVVMARRLGVSRRKGRPAAVALIAEMRRLAHLRMGQEVDPGDPS